jgi:O-antigen ligase
MNDMTHFNHGIKKLKDTVAIWRQEPWRLQLIHLCTGIVFLLPLLHFSSGWLRSFYPSLFIQALLFQGLVQVMFVCWITLAIEQKRFRFSWRNPLFLALTLFVLVLSVTQIWSVDPWLSFWGVQTNMLGLVMYWHLYAWFCVLLGSYQTTKSFHRLGIFFGLTAMVFVVGSLFGATSSDFEERVAGLLGNPLHTSSFLLVVFVLLLSMGINTIVEWERRVLLSASGVTLLGIVATGSRSAFWGIVLGTVVGLIGYGLHRSAKDFRFLARRVALLGVGLTAAVVAGYVYFPGLVTRFLNTEFGDRLELAQIGWVAIRAKLFTGWGIGQFSIPFHRLYDPMLHPTLSQGWYAETHNAYLDIGVWAGIVGILMFLLVGGVLLATLIRRMRTAKDDRWITGLVLVGGVTAMMFEQLFMFQTFFQLVAVTCLLAWCARVADPSVHSSHTSEHLKRWWVTRIMGGTVMIGMVGMLVVVPIVHEQHAMNMRQHLLEGAYGEALETFQFLQTLPSVYQYQTTLNLSTDIISGVLGYGFDSEDAKKLVHVSAEVLEDLMHRHPLQSKLFVAGIPLVALDVEAEDRLGWAMETLKQLYFLQPNTFNAPLTKVRVALAVRNYVLAEAALIELHPFLDGRYGSARANFHIAAVYASKGEYALSAEAAKQASLGGFPIFSDVTLLDAIAVGTKIHTSLDPLLLSYVSEYLEKGIGYPPHVLEQAAILYRNIGEEAEYQSLLSTLREIDSTRAETLEQEE